MSEDKRQYMCFVCGNKFITKDYPSLKDHIINNHEQGREFVVCPLKRCGSPVRDLRTHFKSRHPFDKLPKNCQLRATVWYDIRNPKRKKLPSFKEGFFVSAKNGKSMHFRSGYEEEVYKLLERDPSVKSYEVEPIGIQYYWRSRSRTYIPDLKIHFTDNRTEVWEIKPKNQKSYEQNNAKWIACRAYCEVRGWKFSVITEPEIAALRANLRD